MYTKKKLQKELSPKIMCDMRINICTKISDVRRKERDNLENGSSFILDSEIPDQLLLKFPNHDGVHLISGMTNIFHQVLYLPVFILH